MTDNTHMTIADWLGQTKQDRTKHSERLLLPIQEKAGASFAAWLTRQLGQEFVDETVAIATLVGSPSVGYRVTGGFAEYAGPHGLTLVIDATFPTPQSVDALHWELAEFTYRVEDTQYPTFVAALHAAQAEMDYVDTTDIPD